MRRATYRVEHEVSQNHWWFRGRRRILSRLLADLALPPNARILDAGCGTGANTPALAGHGRVFGADASPVPLSLREGGQAVLARLEGLPFETGSFDLVTALDLLEHLDDDVAGVRELGRVLAPAGRGHGSGSGRSPGQLLVFVPAFEQLWGLQDDVSHHRRRYTAHSLRSLLTRAGLRVTRLSYFNTTLFVPILAARLAMRVVRPPVATENNLTTPTLNRIFGAVFGAEAAVLSRFDLPVGVSLLAVAMP